MRNIRNGALLLLLSFILLANSSGQSDAEVKDMFLEAESYFLFEEYNEALPLYTKLLRKNPYNDNLNYRIGRCYLHHTYKKNMSIEYLEKAIKNVVPDYKEGSFKETKAPVDAFFYLAEAYRVNNKLEEAIKYYKKFSGLMNDLIYDKELVEKKINSCRYALELEKKPIDFISQNLGETVNSRYEETNPIISGDGLTLAFTRKLKFYDAIFVSYKENGEWANSVNIIPQLGVDGDVLTCSFNYEGDELYLYRSDGYNGNIYISERNTKNRWGHIERLNNKINTKFWESHASVSRDGKTLYFTSNRNGGYGLLDIYKSEMQDDGEWGEAENLGSTINTEYNEEAPFISENENILFFSSFGHQNIGGYDIYYCEKDSRGKWKEPVNFGYPINTPDDELFFSPFDNGKFAYIALFEDNTYGLKDIYKLEIFWKLNPKKPEPIESPITQKDIKEYDEKQLATTVIKEPEPFEQIEKTEVEEKQVATREQVYFPDIDAQEIPQEKKTEPEIIQETSQPEELKPTLIVKSNNIEVNSNKELDISLKVEKDCKLIIKCYNNSRLNREEEFFVKNDSFILKYKPTLGENIIEITIIDKNQNSKTETIAINYTSSPYADEIKQDRMSGTLGIINYEEFLSNLLSSSKGNLKSTIRRIKREGEINDISQLINYLITNVDNNRYSVEEVLTLLLSIVDINQIDIDDFYNILLRASKDRLRQYISSISIHKNEIKTPSKLLLYIVNNEPKEIYSIDDITECLTNIVLINYKTTSEKDTKTEKIKKDREKIKIFKNLKNNIIFLIGSIIFILIILFVLFIKKR